MQYVVAVEYVLLIILGFCSANHCTSDFLTKVVHQITPYSLQRWGFGLE